jgi:hypothetical protein
LPRLLPREWCYGCRAGTCSRVRRTAARADDDGHAVSAISVQPWLGAFDIRFLRLLLDAERWAVAIHRSANETPGSRLQPLPAPLSAGSFTVTASSGRPEP